jgi:hypothetical protein
MFIYSFIHLLWLIYIKNLTRTAAKLTSTLLAHHIAVKLEMILDRETKLSHETFAAQIEGRLGSGDKGPDMKVWDKGKNLGKVRFFSYCRW